MRLVFALSIILLATSWLPATAQEKTPLVTLEAEIEAARKQMVTERKLVIAGELVLTPDESKAFWPVYSEYLDDMRAVGDDEVRLITEFADNYREMSDEFADRMLRDHLDIQSRTLKIRRNYLKRFKKVLPTIKVAKLYQVENKLDAVIDYQLASQIPMIGK
ncbi:MAG: hypothetical protein ACN4GT_04135 [Gammaproteobacteria bacterium]